MVLLSRRRRRRLLFEHPPYPNTNPLCLSSSPTDSDPRSDTPIDDTHTDTDTTEALVAAMTALKRDSSASCPAHPQPHLSQVSTELSSGLPLRYQRSSSIVSSDDKRFISPKVMKNKNPRSRCIDDDLSLARKSVVLELDRRLKNATPNKPPSMRSSREVFIPCETTIDSESLTTTDELEGKSHLGLTYIDNQYRASSDEYYTANNCSGYENSDVESFIEEHRRSSFARPTRMRRPDQYISADQMKKEIENRLTTFKEARIQKLMIKLRKREAEISEWETKQTMKARMKMNQLQMKMEKKHARGLQEMRRNITHAQKKAEKKKLRERASTMKKMTEIADAIEMIRNNGKLPWKLLFC